MGEIYKIVLTPEDNGTYTVFVPDFGTGTQGESLEDAMYMARDLIEIMAATLRGMGKDVPAPGTAECIAGAGETIAQVEVGYIDNKKVVE